jgi:hypothetical protein
MRKMGDGERGNRKRANGKNYPPHPPHLSLSLISCHLNQPNGNGS